MGDNNIRPEPAMFKPNEAIRDQHKAMVEEFKTYTDWFNDNKVRLKTQFEQIKNDRLDPYLNRGRFSSFAKPDGQLDLAG